MFFAAGFNRINRLAETPGGKNWQKLKIPILLLFCALNYHVLDDILQFAYCESHFKNTASAALQLATGNRGVSRIIGSFSEFVPIGFLVCDFLNVNTYTFLISIGICLSDSKFHECIVCIIHILIY